MNKDSKQEPRNSMPAGLTLATSTVGPNRYLTQRDFYMMLAVAFTLHGLAFAISAWLPSDTVTTIPVRALSFKLGDENRLPTFTPPVAPPAAVAPPAPPVMQASANESWRATPNTTSPALPAPLQPIAKPMVKPVATEKTVPLAPAAIVPTPQQHVREVGAPPSPATPAATLPEIPKNTGAAEDVTGAQNATPTTNDQAVQAIRARYEQEISGWIQRHKFYPANALGREGRAIVRMRIDRAGNVRYYAIEQSAGMAALDAAALDMIRRANPVPAVPASYPAGNLVEFLIPITFKAPL